jgi:hypothetical protein
MLLGLAEGCLGRRDAAIVEFERAIDAGYRPFIRYALLAGHEGAKGNDVEAKLALTEARRLNPQLTIKWYLENSPNPPGVIEGLRRAGLPEE